MHSVLETPTFRAATKELKMEEDEIAKIVDEVAENPKIGDLIPGTGGARKFRFGRGSKGKSGGYRIITYYAADDVPVFLLDIFAKGEKINLSQAERNELKQYLGGVAEDYRKCMASRVTRITENAS